MNALLIGEAFGRREADFNHALVGPSGRELTLELGLSGFAPFMNLRCRNCKKISRFLNGRCEFCSEFLWPNEFDLIDHWKRLRDDCGIAVSNVFNEHPPEICKDCGSADIAIGSYMRCKVCRSRNIASNDLGWFFGTDRETELPRYAADKLKGGYLKKEHYHHLKRLWNEIEELDPNLIILMGNTPCWAILGETKIRDLRGTVNWSEKVGKKCLPTYHPAYVIRPTGHPMRPIVITDYTKAKREAQFPNIHRPERWITIPNPNEEGIDEIRTWLSTPAVSFANDIETIRNRISIIGFASSPFQSLVIPFRDCHSKNGKIIDIGKIADSLGYSNNGINFWPTKELEKTAWKLAISGLKSSISKTFQNGIFDISNYMKMGIFPNNCGEDTMLFHHSEYPELPKSLGFLGSLYSNDIPWKLMSKQDSLKRDE